MKLIAPVLGSRVLLVAVIQFLHAVPNAVRGIRVSIFESSSAALFLNCGCRQDAE